MLSTEIVENSNQSQELSIYIKNQKFADLILNFLGKKEKLVYEEEISYLLNHNDIEQFYYLLDAKLRKERNMILDHFLVTVLYNDKTQREISGIESLKNFQETRHVHPTSVTLTWNLILNFPNSESIENQTIDLTFNNLVGKRTTDEGKVLLTIAHTNQAWGIEVLNLLKDKIKNVSIEKPKQYKWAKYFKSTPINELIMPLMFIIFTISTLINSEYLHSKPDSAEYYSIVESSKDLDNLEIQTAVLALEKMNSEDINKVATNLIKSKNLKEQLIKINSFKSKNEKLSELMPWVIGFLTTLVLIVAFYPGYVTEYYGSQSHILITKRAESNHKSEIDAKNKTVFYSLSFIAVTLVLGLAVNCISLVIKI